MSGHTRVDGAVAIGVVVLGGGRATRLPGKLTADAAGEPLIVRVLRNVRGASNEIVIASNRALAADLRAIVDVPVVVDAEDARGPVAGLLAAFTTMRSSPIFAVAGDAPFIDAAFATRLAVQWRAGDEALVPIHDTIEGAPQSEPLAALYDRDAFLREAPAILRSGRGALRLVVEALRARYVHVADDARTFTNVNTPQDYASFTAELRARGEIA